MIRLFAVMITGLILMAMPVEAACSKSFYSEANSRANRIESLNRQCNRAARRNRTNIDRICAACGPLASSLLSFERFLRRNRSCLVTARDRRVLRVLSSARDELRFVKRGCGY